MKNIIAPIDLSPISRTVVEEAAAMARAFAAKLWIVHVAAPDPDFVGFRTGPQYIRDHRADVLKREHAALHEMRDAMIASGTDCEALLVQGPTSATILEEQEQLKADVIVMGSHGRSGLFKALIGSVCEQVLSESKVPVHIIPTRDRG